MSQSSKNAFPDTLKGKEIFYQDDTVKVTREGVQISERFYPVRDIRKAYIEKAENRFVWIRMLICLALLMPAMAMAEDFLGKGPIGFLMIVGLTAPLLLVGGGAVYRLYRPSYYLFFQSFLFDNSVLESNSLYQTVKIKRAVLKAVKIVQKEAAHLEKKGEILNFF